MNWSRKHQRRGVITMASFWAVMMTFLVAVIAGGQSTVSRLDAAEMPSTGAPKTATAMPVPPPGVNPGASRLTLDFDNVEIQTFIKAIGEMTGKNFVIDKQVQGNITVFSPQQISAEEAYRVFQSVLEANGYTTVPAGAVIKVLPSKDAREKNIATLLQDEAGGLEDRLITRIVKLKVGSPEEVKKVLDPLVSKDSIVQAYSPSGILIITDVESNIQRLLKIINALDGELEKNTSSIHVYPLKYANAEELAKSLLNLPPKEVAPENQKGRPALSKNVQILPDKATNALIITASAEDYTLLQDIIQQLDYSRPMVYIEALILEVNAAKDFKLGTEWRGTGTFSWNDGTGTLQTGSGGLGADGSYQFLPNAGPSSYASGFTLGVLGTGITLGGITFPNISAMVQAVKTDSDVHILSQPQLLTMDNEEANLHVGKNVPYATRKETTATADLDYTTYEYRDVGVSLKITPHVNSDGFVRLKIFQEVSQVVTDESKTGLPTTLKRTVNTTVTVKNTETMVIGGMIGDNTQQDTYKVPLLGDIPILGWLFKSRASAREKTNLYVFITPRIVRDQEDAGRLSKEKSDALEKEKAGSSTPDLKKGNP